MPGSQSREKPILGIDLGTTNTCVAHVRNRIPRVVPTDKGSLVLPSVVALSEKGDYLVGGVAKDQMVTNPRNTIYGVKRLIGRKFNSKVVQELRSYYSYDIVEGPSGESAVSLGGGTFDVSVLQLRHNVFEVLATGGDTFLGGVDFDNRIIDFALDVFWREHKIDLAGSPIAMQRIKNAAEAAKIDLTLVPHASLELPYIEEHKGKPLDLRVPLSRTQLNELTADLVDRTFRICDEVLAEKRLSFRDIDEVILVGGQSRMPLVQDGIREHFGRPPRKGVHPDECVALGAALLGDSLDQIDSVTLVDVLSMPIGVATGSGRFRRVLEKNNAIPCSRSFRLPPPKEPGQPI